MLLNVSQSHIITLSINTLLALLPLSTKTYYGTTDDEGKQVCTFSTGNGSMKNTLTWVDNLVHIELIICFIILFVLTVIIIFNDKCQRKNNLTTPFVESIQKGWITILFYPLAMFCSWLPGIIFAWYVSEWQKSYVYPPSRSTEISSLLTIFNSLYGLFLAIIFYSQTSDARKCWIDVFNQIINRNNDSNITQKYSIDISQNSSIDYSTGRNDNMLN